MDKKALFEIERAIKRALFEFQMQTKPIVCTMCMNEMEIHRRFVVCRYCGIVHRFDWKSTDSETEINRGWG